MWTASKIRRFVFALPKGKLFASMELVHLGPRYMIDHTTSMMVKMEQIIRVARGVFIRNDPGVKIPSAEEIAAHKAKVFSKRMVTHGANAAAKLGLINWSPRRTVFATNGCTSSFYSFSQKRRIYFQGLSDRKVDLGNTPVGLVIRALWFMRKKRVEPIHLDIAGRSLNRITRDELRRRSRFMPGWLIKHYWWGRPDLEQVLSA